jgi:hypothetical protein
MRAGVLARYSVLEHVRLQHVAREPVDQKARCVGIRLWCRQAASGTGEQGCSFERRTNGLAQQFDGDFARHELALALQLSNLHA